MKSLNCLFWKSTLAATCCMLVTIVGCKRQTQSDDSEFFIYGGETVAEHDALYHVNASIGKIDKDGTSIPSSCSGVVMSEKTVLTTSACFSKSETRVFVHFGHKSVYYANAFVIHDDPIEIPNTGSFKPGLALISFEKSFTAPVQVAQWVEESEKVNPNSGRFSIYALGQNNSGVYGELRSFEANMLDATAEGYEANGMLATGDEGGGLFVETVSGKRLLGVVSGAPSSVRDGENTRFIDIRKYKAWLDCATLNLAVFADHLIGLPPECAVLQVYGLEKPN